MAKPLILDPQTGAHSIDYLEYQMRSEVAYSLRHGMPMCLVLLSVDGYEELVATFGGEAQNGALQELVGELQAHIRTEDILARYGVAEFALLLRGTPLAAGKQLAQRICESVDAAQFTHEGVELPITTSIGVGALTPAVEQHSQVVQSAERALQAARKIGNTVVVAAEL